MALTKEQWFQKLKGWVPTWFFSSAEYQEAHFYALAELLRLLQVEMEAHRDQTFILQSTAPTLDLHGAERSTTRFAAEPDAHYADRIRLISNTVTVDVLDPAINATLNNGVCIFIENWAYGWFDEDAASAEEYFFDTEDTIWLDKTKTWNWFTVVIPIQTGGTPSVIQSDIISAIEANKALGVAYDVMYRTV
jgi:hypothetical protein